MIEGVFEGVLASAIFAAGTYYFTTVCLPLIRGRLRQLPKLNQTIWNRVYEDRKEHPRSTLKIMQSGTKIRASVERLSKNGRRVFEYRGEFSGHQMILQWEDVGSPEVIVGAMVLHLSQDLKRLSGQTVYFSQAEGRVVNQECTYVRVGNE
jgi:hypothetical protein